MKRLILCLVAFSGLILSRPPEALAQYWVHAQFHLTATVQEPFTGEPAQTFREKVIKIDNTKLLELLGTATTNDFTGADLVVDHSGWGFSVMRGTNILADVSSLLSRSASGAFVVQGKQSSDLAGDVTRKAVWQFHFAVSNGDYSFSFSAHERARIIWNLTDTNSPTYFENDHSYGLGEGLWKARTAIFTGTVELSAESPEVRTRDRRAATPGTP